MTSTYKIICGLYVALIILASFGFVRKTSVNGGILLKDATLIDGKGAAPEEHTDLLIQDDKIAALGRNLEAPGARVIDLKGKTIIPALISTHVHIGVIKGNAGGGEYYTRNNILSQLRRYQDYGIGSVLAMGTDRPLLFETGLRDSSLNNLLPGARLYSAGYGFNVPDRTVSSGSAFGNLYRPASASEVPAMIERLAKLKPELVKIWVDGAPSDKMKPEIYQAIIREAHKHHLRVAAHVYYLSDARKLVAAGIDIFAHSIRDSVIDDDLIRQMKAKNIVYIPTLSLDKYAYAYAQRPEWINDAFFKASLEPGVYEMLTSEKYQNEVKNSSAYSRNITGFEIAMKNVKKLSDAGVLISLGTDSGAFPVRAQGFSEHLEMELLVQAGLSPLQAISVATRNAARVLRINSRFGTLEKGKTADLIILNSSPVNNIKNTRTIEAVYKSGKEVSKGPLAY